MDFLAMLQQYVDPVAVLISIIVTQLIKGLIPSPEGQGKWAVGPILNRFLPYIPVLMGILTIILKDVIVCNGAQPMAYDDAIIKGMISGAMGAYLYRTAKVTLFGG
jgi:branched-subunit amino acid transport protein